MKSKADMRTALHHMIEPLEPYFSPGHTRLWLGSSNSYCGKDIGGLEAFSRILWGLVPLLAGGGMSSQNESIRRKILDGIRNGTNPQHEEYWGDVKYTDQRLVEMAVFGLALSLAPSVFWDPLTTEEKHNLVHWLSQINHNELPPNNWHFFRVLVNIGLESVGQPSDADKLRESLELIESLYVGDGWYSDDNRAFQRDYYISFAFHFYGLIYSVLMKEKDPERSAVYVKRARQFSHDFMYWFSEDGSALPFGRSLTYRFAQVSFWCAMAFAGVDDDYDYGVMKGLVMRHLRWWLERDIFSPEGLLTIGYAYANLNMAESYNAPGSPYWALKSFLVLALPDEHPFWQAEEKPLPKLQSRSIQKHAGMILCHDDNHHHVYALTSGQLSYTEHSHNEAKYAKFAYSNRFGFSVPKGMYGLSYGAFDSMLALSEQDGYYRGRRECELVEWQNEVLYSRWRPWRDVTIDTWLVPINGQWHVRIHRIETNRPLASAEGGFAIPQGTAEAWGTSEMIDLIGNRRTDDVTSEPNTNIIHSGSNRIPTLRGELEAGIHWYGAAVFASVDGEATQQWREQAPVLIKDQGVWQIQFKGTLVASITGTS
ncbi:DUF2264 domain-containing protein [Marinicrinis lubricantis]